MAGDGQVTVDKTVMKHGARKVRTVAGGKVLAGFAGSAADGITLLDATEQLGIGDLPTLRNEAADFFQVGVGLIDVRCFDVGRHRDLGGLIAVGIFSIVTVF